MTHHTKSESENIIQSTLENVKLREEAVAKCTNKIKRRVLRNHVRNTRTYHLMKYCLEPRKKKKAKRKPLTELYVNGNITEDREE